MEQNREARELAHDLALAHRIAEAAAQAGGRAYFVGGFVRDRLMGRPCKDVDLEVHGLAPEALAAILDGIGERKGFGASFGVYSLAGTHLDIAMPRREHATGRGHRDFAIDVDPYIGVREAARRRDFTVNAMLLDVLTEELIDPYGGEKDLALGVLRHVDDVRFGEDPLRVLRAAQFSARLGFAIAPETVRLCAEMDLTALARERVFEELKKALLQAEQPSVFFDALRGMGQLDFWFPEVRALIDCPQDPLYHPEGDVYIHTMRVLDAAAGLRAQAKEPLMLMLSALCHDMGKPETTQLLEGHIHAYGHEKAGVSVAERFLARLTSQRTLLDAVLNHVLLHMRPTALLTQRSGAKAYMRLFDESKCPEDLILLCRADRLGTGQGFPGDDGPLYDRLATYHMLMREPYVTARDLADAGIPPGKAYAGALALAKRMQLSLVPRKEALPQVIAEARRLDAQGRTAL